jgi:hypothetical protein
MHMRDLDDHDGCLYLDVRTAGGDRVCLSIVVHAAVALAVQKWLSVIGEALTFCFARVLADKVRSWGSQTGAVEADVRSDSKR